MFKLLDLFCGAGGASMGYARAGFGVVGVDAEKQPNYPFAFIHSDVHTLSDEYLQSFDVVVASPPCQVHTVLRNAKNIKKHHTDLIPYTRSRLVDLDVIYVIENVRRAVLNEPIMLCGTMFDGLRVRRHRYFESNVELPQLPCGQHHRVINHANKAAYHETKHWNQWTSHLGVYGQFKVSLDAANDAMGTNWMRTKYEVAQAIPPAYTEFIGKHLIEALQGKSHTTGTQNENRATTSRKQCSYRETVFTRCQ